MTTAQTTAQTTGLTTLEFVTFRLLPGTDDDAFLAAARATEALVRRQPGFVSRRLSRGADGTWTDTVEWRSLAEARQAAQAVMADAAFAPFMARIDSASAAMRHETLALRMD